jgi:hypothetical protein
MPGSLRNSEVSDTVDSCDQKSVRVSSGRRFNSSSTARVQTRVRPSLEASAAPGDAMTVLPDGQRNLGVRNIEKDMTHLGAAKCRMSCLSV